MTEKDIRAEAKRLSKMTDFKASKGWYCKFSRRFNQWKKQEREKAIQRDGPQAQEGSECFLLPEISDSDEEESSDSQEQSDLKQS